VMPGPAPRERRLVLEARDVRQQQGAERPGTLRSLTSPCRCALVRGNAICISQRVPRTPRAAAGLATMSRCDAVMNETIAARSGST